MTMKLTSELREAIEAEGGRPLHIVDVDTNVHYVLILAEQHENLKALVADGGVFDPRELYPLMAKSAAAAGWDEPELDVYNDCAVHKTHLA